MALTNQQQAIYVLAAILIPTWIAWLGLGAPTDHAGLILLAAGNLGGILFYIKEVLGNASPVVPTGSVVQTTVVPPTGTPTTTTSKTAVTDIVSAALVFLIVIVVLAIIWIKFF